jgi:hypothetical protein
MAFPFFTIGHSTRPIGEFIDLLAASQVSLVVDVRTFRAREQIHNTIETYFPYRCRIFRSLMNISRSLAASARERTILHPASTAFGKIRVFITTQTTQWAPASSLASPGCGNWVASGAAPSCALRPSGGGVTVGLLPTTC